MYTKENLKDVTKDGAEKLSLEVRIVDLTLLGSKKDAEPRTDAKAEQNSER